MARFPSMQDRILDHLKAEITAHCLEAAVREDFSNVGEIYLMAPGQLVPIFTIAYSFSASGYDFTLRDVGDYSRRFVSGYDRPSDLWRVLDTELNRLGWHREETKA